MKSRLSDVPAAIRLSLSLIHISVPQKMASSAEALAAQGKTPLFFAKDGTCLLYTSCVCAGGDHAGRYHHHRVAAGRADGRFCLGPRYFSAGHQLPLRAGPGNASCHYGVQWCCL